MKGVTSSGAIAALCAGFVLAGLLLAGASLRAPPSLGTTAALGAERCAPTSRPGLAGSTDDLHTPQGLAISVRTPRNYDPTRAQPLLVVYPPAGFERSAAERYYGLTEEATQQGWIVAYAAPVPLSRRALALQQEVGGAVARRWCVDAGRVAFLGHSDGATVAEGVLLRSPGLAPYPRYLLASAAGLQGSDFTAEACPRAVDLTVVHSPADAHFPRYGRQAVQWWAACFGCRGALPAADRMPADSCVDLGPCAAGGRVRYCEAHEGHAAWPRVAAHPLRFFDSPPASIPPPLSLTSRSS